MFGPLGALVLAVLVIVGLTKVVQKLWEDHLRADADDRKQRDDAQALLAVALDGTKRMAEAWEARNRRDVAARRKTDPS